MTLFKATFIAVTIACASLAPASDVLASDVLAQAPRANVEVSNAWVRSTVPGQMGTGAFMKITAKEGITLVGVLTPLAGVSEVHEMKMEGDVMKMRAVPALDLPAGTAVELKPGGYHIMLMDLKQPLLKNSKVPLTLLFKDAKGVQSKVALTLPVTNAAPVGASGHSDSHKH